MYNLLEARHLFTSLLDDQGNYCPDAHLAEMIALLGPPPKELIDREREGMTQKLPSDFRNENGKLCQNASEWFGGPFFDADGMQRFLDYNV